MNHKLELDPKDFMYKSATRLSRADSNFKPARTWDAHQVEKQYEQLQTDLADLQESIFAENKHKILIVLQGLDTSGKDGTVKHVFKSCNPMGLRVASFKKPTLAELRYDFLWRIHKEVPAAGEIVIFNRSHYEDYVVPDVHGAKASFRKSDRIAEIRHFEKMLVDEGVTMIKFFLNISRAEQARRIQERIDNPKKHWKFSVNDLTERRYWDQYQKSYAHVITRTHELDRPWYIIPADQKSARDIIISTILVDTLRKLKPRLPRFEARSLKKIQREIKRELK
jgi:PPK2 family polyphosphate:nucleotide phosphotransferase